ncbi:MAG: ion transporter [Chitinivibrionales bacterium]|nr:ion transporter [Chitinivibrionales bacterium]MBD3356892.1 ion transporter [Chitinivibrionales bacterium]
MVFRERMHEVIFGTETPAGRFFDILLLWAIVASVMTVVLESVRSIQAEAPEFFYVMEWLFTVLFTFEYLARIISSPHPASYVFSFWGVIDLLAVIPTYAGLLAGGAHYLLAIRTIRLLRVFRILKLGKYLRAAEIIVAALKASSYKITVFLLGVFTVVIVMGTLMYMVEGGGNGFENIPISIYWAIVTITTVGFGDIVPNTPFGKCISSLMMIIGYAIIAVPTGIVTVELGRQNQPTALRTCTSCGNTVNEPDARYCKKCGAKLQ